jgi:predicted HicB family RNase H-like nuclease
MSEQYEKQFKIRNWSRRSKELLYRKAYQSGLSLNEQIKKVIRDYLHKEYPNEIIE